MIYVSTGRQKHVPTRMIGGDVLALHAMARKLGATAYEDAAIPCYTLTAEQRQAALKAGAMSLPSWKWKAAAQRILSQLKADSERLGVPLRDFIQQIKLSDEVITEVIEEEQAR